MGSLSGEDVVAMVLDGKTFADATMVVALGITLSRQTFAASASTPRVPRRATRKRHRCRSPSRMFVVRCGVSYQAPSP